MSATGTTAARAAGPAPGFLRRALRAGPYAWIVWGGVAFFLVNLAALILSAGGARASEDAPPDLLAAEEQARSERTGMWGGRR